MSLAKLAPRAIRLRGMSLIEVMVAVLILSVGLLGMGSLMAVSLRNTQSAAYRTHAANIAYEYTELLRSYISRGANSQAELIARSNFSGATCNRVAAPAYACGNNAQAVNCDRQRISERACRALPDGRVRARLNRIGGAERRIEVQVDVCWLDDRSQTALTTADCSAASETLFSLTSEL
jgi:type IV pilus assembly protein PilV